jgi:hypothetical protein
MAFGVSYLRPFAFEKLTLVATVVTPFTSATWMDKSNPSDYALARSKAMEAVVTVETADIRFRTDGGNPDATTGHSAAIGSAITITGGTAIANFKAYSAGAAVLQITYYNG